MMKSLFSFTATLALTTAMAQADEVRVYNASIIGPIILTRTC